MSSKSMTNARAIVNVLAARLEGDHERSAKDWDTIRLQAAQLAGFAKRKRDEAAAMGEPEPTPNPSRGRSPSSDDAGREAPRKAIDELPMRVSAYYVSRGRGDHVYAIRYDGDILTVQFDDEGDDIWKRAAPGKPWRRQTPRR